MDNNCTQRLKDYPVISVVVPLYNKAKYIKRTIDSVTKQSFSDFEIIIVDDGSTDGGDAIVEKISKNERRIRLIKRTNGGQSAARNTGIKFAKGDLIAFIDADDQWDIYYLEALVSMYNKFPNAGVFATGYKIVYEHSTFEISISAGGIDTIKLLRDYFKKSQIASVVWVSAMAIPKKVLSEFGCFLVGEHIGGDTELVSRILLYLPLAYDSRVLSIYRADAQGRENPRRDRKIQTPPFARTYHLALNIGGLSKKVINDAQEYVNRLWIQYINLLISHYKRREIKTVIKENIVNTKRFRVKVWYLKIASIMLPMPVFNYLNRLLYSRYLTKASSLFSRRGGVIVRKL